MLRIIASTEVFGDKGTSVPAFDYVTVEEFKGIKFPCFLHATGNYSDYFNWSEWSGFECLAKEVHTQTYGGSMSAGQWVNSPGEAVEYLQRFINYPYNTEDNTEYHTLFEIFLKGFSKQGTIVELANGGVYLQWDTTNTYFTPEEEVKVWGRLATDSELIEFFDQFDLNWSEIVSDQVNYIRGHHV